MLLFILRVYIPFSALIYSLIVMVITLDILVVQINGQSFFCILLNRWPQ